MPKTISIRQTIKKVILQSVLSTLILGLILLTEAMLISREVIPLSIGKAYILSGAVIAGTWGGWTAARSQTEKKLLCSMFCAAFHILWVTVAGWITNKGAVGTGLLYTALAIAAGGITGCIIATFKPKRRKR